MIKEVDYLGRILIPKDIRRQLKIKTGDQVDVQIRGDQIVIQKLTEPPYQPRT